MTTLQPMSKKLLLAVERWLNMGYSDEQIHAIICDRHNVDPEIAWRYLSTAKTRITDVHALTLAEKLKTQDKTRGFNWFIKRMLRGKED